MTTHYIHEAMRNRRTQNVSERRIDRKRTKQAKQQTRTRKLQRQMKRGV